MRTLPLITGLAAIAALAACTAPRQVGETPPTVTYSYRDAKDLDEIQRRGELHCEQNYGRDAVLIDHVLAEDDREATFACE